MSSHQPIVVYLLFFLVLSILLKILNVIEFSVIEILGYAFIFYGISKVYLSFGKDKKAALFGGTIIFLVGIIFFLTGKFDFPNPSALLLPSTLYIFGAGFLMLFIDDMSNVVLIIIAAAFIVLGISTTILTGIIEFNSFVKSVGIVAESYWPVMVILVGILFLLRKD